MSSRPGGKPVERLAADANVLLSAVLEHAAERVFSDTSVHVVTTDEILEEVREHIPLLAAQYGVGTDALLAKLALLNITPCGPETYKDEISKAKLRIAKRDPDDVGLLALALHFGVPIWSNDNDFEGTGVEWLTTARLLKALGIKRR